MNLSSKLCSLEDLPRCPDSSVDASDVFGIKGIPFPVPSFSQRCGHVPDIDEAYVFDSAVTKAILCGLAYNLRVLVHGYHGTGKSTHIEQVAARLNWPCVRINLDGQVSRLDLVGKDSITLRQGKQVTDFVDGILPWAISRPVILCLDEYDAGRPDVMFLLQRVLEAQGRLTLLDQSRVIEVHESCRIFATANTVGLGDSTGIYHGTQPINQGQLDRWSAVVRMGFPDQKVECQIVLRQCPFLNNTKGKRWVRSMVELAALTREGFAQGDTSVLISPRTLIAWAHNIEAFGDLDEAFVVTYLNRCDETEHETVSEYYQRCFNRRLVEA